MSAPKTLSELYRASVSKYPNSKDAQRAFRQDLYRSLSESEKQAIYLEDMLNPYNPTYEQYMGNGWTPEQYEFYVRNSPDARALFEELYGF